MTDLDKLDALAAAAQTLTGDAGLMARIKYQEAVRDPATIRDLVAAARIGQSLVDRQTQHEARGIRTCWLCLRMPHKEGCEVGMARAALHRKDGASGHE